MPMFEDICRICLQEVHYHDVQEISVPKLHNLITGKPFINFSFMQKWQTELFQDHLICSTCIYNFRTITMIYKSSYKANIIITCERNKRQLSKVNLNRLPKFSHIEGDFLVCRLCLNPTSQIVVYLYDNIKNILPVEYIRRMLKHLKINAGFNNTINPILCNVCWQNIQSSYAFSKRLEVVTEKMIYYQSLVDKMYIDREDLQDALHMWDKLGINIKTEMVIGTKQVIQEEYISQLNDDNISVKKLGRPPGIKKNISRGKNEYSFCGDHSYCRIEVDVNNTPDNEVKGMPSLKKITETTKCVKDNSDEMPILKPNIDGEGDIKAKFKFQSNVETSIQNKSDNTRILRSKMRFIEDNNGDKLNLKFHGDLAKQNINSGREENTETFETAIETKAGKQELIKSVCKKESKHAANKKLMKITTIQEEIEITQNKQKEKSKNTSYKEKLRNIKKHAEISRTDKTKNKKQIENLVKKGKMVHAVQKEPKSKANSAQNLILSKILTGETLRPATRLSTKKEIMDYPYSQDLLVLRKEEIIKKKRHRKKLNATVPKYTSTPKISKNVSFPAVENSPGKSVNNSEYTFETLNLDDEVHIKKEVIEEEELQIKREMLSECESDDNFTENTGCTTYTDDFEEDCPNLESFIKSEPPDLVMDLDEEGPPELELQGPCQSVPMPIPCFTIQNTFTVDEKRHLMNTVDEKRNLLHLFEEKTPSIKPTGSAIQDKFNVVSTPGIDSRRGSNHTDKQNLSKAIEETAPSIKGKCDLFEKATVLKSVEKEGCTNFNKKFSIDVLKSNLKAALTFQKEKTPKIVAGCSNANVATHASESSERSRADTLMDTYKTIDRLRIGPKNPFFCQLCDFSSVFTTSCKSHLTQHLSNCLCLHRCKICAFKSTQKKKLLAHIQSEHPCQESSNSLHLHICKFCPFATRRKASLLKHVNSEHTKKECHDNSTTGAAKATIKRKVGRPRKSHC